MKRASRGRGATLVQCLKIVRRLANDQRVTLDGLAEELGTTRRTITRHLQAIEQAGFPLYEGTFEDDDESRGRDEARKYWSLLPDRATNRVLRVVEKA